MIDTVETFSCSLLNIFHYTLLLTPFIPLVMLLCFHAMYIYLCAYMHMYAYKCLNLDSVDERRHVIFVFLLPCDPQLLPISPAL